VLDPENSWVMIVSKSDNSSQDLISVKRAHHEEIDPLHLRDFEEVTKSIEMAACKPCPLFELNRIYVCDTAQLNYPLCKLQFGRGPCGIWR